jgi:hypothetical protein
MAEPQVYPYRDPTSLVKWTRWSIYAQMGITAVAIMSGYLEYEVLAGLRDGVFESDEAATAAAEASDARQGIVAIIQFLILVVSGFLILRWIHRVNWNARALGAQGMTFTPGWCVGWYFIPVMCLWKPYQAMQEIWKASKNPAAWTTEKVPQLVGLWWAIWIVYSMAGNASFRLSMRADEINEFVNSTVVTIASDVAALPLCVALLALMTQVQAMQDARRPGPKVITPA